MGSNVETIKDRLDIVEVISPYLKLEKAGANLKARCPFHNEKTPSFFISQARQGYYCFGCGAKGDMFTFIEEMEGTDFRGALGILADKAGVELRRETQASSREKEEREKLLSVLESATSFFESELEKTPRAREYLEGRGVSEESAKVWRLGVARDDWRALYLHLTELGFEKELIVKAGLAKVSEEGKSKEPYDVFRDRLIFPLKDAGGRVVGFSGRSLSKDVEPKYLNSPDTPLFTKSELLYGFDKAKEDIRRKNYSVLVEGQLDLVLSHQAGIGNTVASSGTAFTTSHLERLKKISPRIVLAFDGDEAGSKAVEKSTTTALGLGMEVKVARTPAGSDPADIIKKSQDEWKDVLRNSVPAIEYLLSTVLEEADTRKRGKLIESRILPLILLLESAIERSYFVALVSRRSGIKEDMVWEDLSKLKVQNSNTRVRDTKPSEQRDVPRLSKMELIEERLKELSSWQGELDAKSREMELLEKERAELELNKRKEELEEELATLRTELARAEGEKDTSEERRLAERVDTLLKEKNTLEQKSKVV